MEKGDIYICDRICLAQGRRVKIVKEFVGGYQERVMYTPLSADNMGVRSNIGETETLTKKEFFKFYSKVDK